MQTEPQAKSPRFTNYITADDGSFVPPSQKKPKATKGKAAAPQKNAAKNKAAAKAPAAKKPPAKRKPKDDLDGYEEA